MPKRSTAKQSPVPLRMARTTSEELIPRDVLFGNPEYAGPALSPDGTRLAFLRPDRGVLNVFVREVGSTEDRLVTDDRLRGIRGVRWAQDSKTLLYNQDEGGDENFHLFAIDATTPGAKAIDLTPFKGAKAQNVITNKRYPDQLLVAINNRDPAKFDMYRVDLPTALAGDALGALSLDTENPGNVVGWGTEDESFEVRAATVINSADSSNIVRVRDNKAAAWCVHARTHTSTRTHAHAHAHPRTHAPTHTHSHAHKHKHTKARTHMHACKCVHAQTRMHAQTHAHG